MGGFRSQTHTAEIVELNPKGPATCPQPVDNPYGQSVGAGAFVDGKALLYNNAMRWSHYSHFQTPKWRSLEETSRGRVGPGSVVVNSHTLWVSGGYNLTDTSEVYQNGQFRSGPALPMAMAEHCVDIMLEQIETPGAVTRGEAVDAPLIVRGSARVPEGWTK